jgi:hypothetical protein
MAGDRQSQHRSGEDNLISREQLRDISRRTGLSLYQQEKDYFLKLFLHGYFNRYEDAVFKGELASRTSLDWTGSARILISIS